MAESKKSEVWLKGIRAGALLLSVLAGGCAIEASDGTFLVDPAGVEATLEAACAPPGAVEGPFWVTVSSYTGATYVAEPERNRIWIRSPLGLVSDQCYWVSTDSERPGWPEEFRPECFSNELVQDGSCTGEAHVPEGGGWLFAHGGFVEIPGLAGRLATHGRTAVAWTAAGHPLLRVIDLVPDDDGCPDGQRSWSAGRLLYSLEVPEEYWGFAEGDVAIDGTGRWLLSASPDDKQLALWDLPLPCGHEDLLSEPRTVKLGCSPDGPLAVDPDGDRAFVLCSKAATVVTVDGLSKDEPTVSRRVLSLRRPSDIVYEPVSDTIWVASPAGDKVKGFPAGGGSAVTYAAPGATRLSVGETQAGGVRSGHVYAIGEEPGGVYRFDPASEDARFQAMDEPLLAIAAGTDLQEIVLVSERAGDGGEASYHLRSWLDTEHLSAQADDAVRLVAAAFLEYPRDPQLDDLTEQPQEVAVDPEPCQGLDEDTIGWPSLDRQMYQLCCLQRARADQVAENLAYLERAVLDAVPGDDRIEMLFGVNPTSLLQSSHCIHAGLELDRDVLTEFGLPFLEEVGGSLAGLSARGDLMPVLLVHTSADSEDQIPYTCPELWRPEATEEDCDVVVADQEAFESFLGDLFDTAGLGRVAEDFQGTGGCADGELPLPDGCVDLSDHALQYGAMCGGFDRAVGLYTEYGGVSWPDAYAALHPGGGEPFTYFGSAANYPYTSHAASKELAPWDASLRGTPFPVGADPAAWDVPDPGGTLTYLPGMTVAHTRLYELARSGLLVSDMFFHTQASGDHWADDRWMGEESTDTMGEADFAVLSHYLTYHVLAARDADAQRVLYFHLPDISAISMPTYGGGRVECTEEGECGERDALQDWIRDTLPGLGPAVTWGLPEEYR